MLFVQVELAPNLGTFFVAQIFGFLFYLNKFISGSSDSISWKKELKVY